MIFGCLTAIAFSDRPPPLTLGVAAGVALVTVLAVALASYDAVALLGTVLLGVVFFEPAPPDAVFLVGMAVAAVTGRFALRRVPLSIGLLLGTFLVLNLLAAIYAVDAVRAARFFLITLYLAIFSVWLTGYVDSPKRARLLVRGILFAALTSSVIGSVAVFTHTGFLLKAGRAKALFKDSNVLAPFLVFAALIVIDELIEPRLLRARRSTKIAIFLVLSIGILLAYSRAAWLNVVVGMFTLLLVYVLRRGGGGGATRLLAVILTALAVAVGTIAVTNSYAFLRERAHAHQSYDTQRFAGQAAGIRLAGAYPLGIGPGQFEKTVGIAAHSTYVRALAEEGILGLVVVLALMGVTLLMAGQNVILGSNTYGIGSAPLLATWCGILVNSAFVDTVHWRHFWVVAALIWISAMRRPESIEAPGL